MFRLHKSVVVLFMFGAAPSLAVTAGVDQAQSIARLYSAAFDRIPRIDGLNFWIDSYEAGRSFAGIAGDFYGSPEFTARYGALDARQYVEQLYFNVLGRPGSTAGVDFWTGLLREGTSRANILAGFANAPETVAKTSKLFADMRQLNCRWVFGQADPDSNSVGCSAAPVVAGVSYDGLGYQAEFDRQYEQLLGISSYEFAQRYTGDAGDYLARMTWDVSTAAFWDELQSDTTHYQLNPAEVAMISKNGFVVSERQTGQSFADVYYRIFSEDLPVFITTDSILHAWHRSYDAILREMEEFWLSDTVDAILQGMSADIPELARLHASDEYSTAIEDADLFITVARSLLAGEAVPSRLGLEAEVNPILQAIAAEQTRQIRLFGEERIEIFSQYKPRGHYTRSEALKRYFRAMTWLGRTDLTLAEAIDGEQPAYTLRQLRMGLVLYELLRSSSKLEDLVQVDEFLQLFVGQVDSMTYDQFGAVLRENGIQVLDGLASADQIRRFQSALLQSDWGAQHIQARPFATLEQAAVASLPRSLSFLGQRFTLDSWIMEMTTHSYWDSRRNNARYIPSGLDIAFAVLANNQVAPRLEARMESADGVPWRDGIAYQALLAAGRETIDNQAEAAWHASIYNQWLYTLRALSAPTTDERFPEAMRTSAWASKTLNTQLASWTELRHDAILYVKQTGGGGACYYPEGFVEPRLEFWERLETLARIAGQGIARLSISGQPGSEERLEQQREQVAFLNNFADTVAALGGIARKQLLQQELNADERWYLENVVELIASYVGLWIGNGWYPGLFYHGTLDLGANDALIADVHTVIPTDDGAYDGHALNEATGLANLMAIAIENGTDRVIYLGPVMSHYEFRSGYDERLNDEEWKARLSGGEVPPREEWVLDYLVPVN